jgi:hypothetical protein
VSLRVIFENVRVRIMGLQKYEAQGEAEHERHQTGEEWDRTARRTRQAQDGKRTRNLNTVRVQRGQGMEMAGNVGTNETA